MTPDDKKRIALSGLLSIGLLVALVVAHLHATRLAFADPSRGTPALVLQVSENDPAVWNQALNVAANVPADFGEPIAIEIVAFGPGLQMLKLDSEVGSRLKQAAASGVMFKACGNTMRKMKLGPGDLYPDARIQVVPSGVAEIVAKERQGWSYVKP